MPTPLPRVCVALPTVFLSPHRRGSRPGGSAYLIVMPWPSFAQHTSFEYTRLHVSLCDRSWGFECVASGNRVSVYSCTCFPSETPFSTPDILQPSPNIATGFILINRNPHVEQRAASRTSDCYAGLYALSSLVFYLSHFHSVSSVFLFLYAVGFLTIGWQSRPPLLRGSIKDKLRSSSVATAASAGKTEVAATVGCARARQDRLSGLPPQAAKHNTQLLSILDGRGEKL